MGKVFLHRAGPTGILQIMEAGALTSELSEAGWVLGEAVANTELEKEGDAHGESAKAMERGIDPEAAEWSQGIPLPAADVVCAPGGKRISVLLATAQAYCVQKDIPSIRWKSGRLHGKSVSHGTCLHHKLKDHGTPICCIVPAPAV